MNTTEKVITIQTYFGFKSTKMCELLGNMNYQTFRNKRNPNNAINNFNTKELNTLIRNLKLLCQDAKTL